MTIKSGDIEVILNEPLFSSNSVWYPGYTETKFFQVKNRGNRTKQVQIEALSENETKNLSQGLSLEVRNDVSCIYGCNEMKTLRNFFDVGNLNVGEVPVNDNGKIFTIEAAMPITAEDKYQGGKTSFDLRIGLEGDAESTVVVSGDSTVTSLTPTSAVLGDANDTNIQKVTPTAMAPTVTRTQTETQGTVMGETAPLRQGFEGQNWWFNWWWLVLLLILTALAWWWSRRRKN